DVAVASTGSAQPWEGGAAMLTRMRSSRHRRERKQMHHPAQMDPRDIVEIQQLLGRYGHALDADDNDLLPLVFTQDAIVDERPFGGDRHEGLAAITAWKSQGKPPFPPAHHMTNPVVYVDDGVVRVKSKWLVIHPRDGSGLTGDYDDVVVNT